MKKIGFCFFKSIGFFIFITLLDYLFKFEIDIAYNACFSLVYFIFELIGEYIKYKSDKKKENK